MYCSSCGREIGDSRYCPICGAEQKHPEAEKTADQGTPVFTMPDYGQNSSYDYSSASSYASDEIEQRYRTAFNDPRFLVIAILETVVALVSLIGGATTHTTVDLGGVSVTVSILPILFAIALWLIYISAKSRERMHTTGLAIASGTLKAILIITWIAVILIIVLSVLMIIAGSAAVVSIDSGELSEILKDLNVDINGNPLDIDIYQYGRDFIETGKVILAVVIIILAVILIILNVTCMRKLHRFAKSVCVSLKTGNYNIMYPRAAKNWLIFIAVMSFLAVAGSIAAQSVDDALVIISGLCSGFAAILASGLIRYYFIDGSNY